MSNYPENYKERGEWVELLFMAECARRHLKVAKPFGESCRYDVIVAAGSRLHRVQVKSTTQFRDGNYYCECHRTLMRKESGRRVRSMRAPYTEDDIDFLAVFIIPELQWYIVPVAELRAQQCSFPPPHRAHKHRLGRFSQAWHLLGAEEESRFSIATADPDDDLAFRRIISGLKQFLNVEE